MEYILVSLKIILSPVNIFMLIGGILFGSIFGILPGVSVLTAVVLVLPLTYGLSADSSIILLVAIYVAGIFAGSSTSILFNMPGDPQNAATCIDGFPMTVKGEAPRALGMAIISSALGGTVGLIILVTVTEMIARVSLAFGPAEYFALTFLGLASIAGFGHRQYGKTVLSLLLGLLLATFGVAEVTGESRLTLGFPQLMSGFNFVPVMIGALAMSEMFEQIGQGGSISSLYADRKFKLREGLPTLQDLRNVWTTWIRSSLIGTVIGTLPGAGATVAAFVAYGVESSVNKRRKYFGSGEIAGVAAPETANNAAGMGTFVPMLALGIPGGAVAALIMVALQIHGIQPGPLMFIQQRQIIMNIFVISLLANLLIMVSGAVQVKYVSQLLRVPKEILYPAIAIFCALGAYATDNNIFDVYVMMVSGLLGTYLRTHGFSIIAIILGMVLGPIAEGAFVQGLIIYNSPIEFVMRPLAGTLLLCGLLFLCAPLIMPLLRPLLRGWLMRNGDLKNR
jgi:putative tricarboxylic transport membrane protein